MGGRSVRKAYEGIREEEGEKTVDEILGHYSEDI